MTTSLKKIILLAAVVGIAEAQAQLQDKNLVKNPGFENTQGKLKKNKSIAIAKEWKSPTLLAADLYSKSSKEIMSAAPDNTYGSEEPLEGNNYAGVVMYGYGDKTPRTYITTQLLGPLKKGMKYCVSFNVSLADNSKYAVNNVGAHLHKKEMVNEEPNAQLILQGNSVKKPETIIKHSKNAVLSQSFGWETVCGVYEAEGGEEWITIGNFNPTRETKFEKIAKKKGSSTQQVPIAYYYIDDVKVFPLDSIAECQCEIVTTEKPKVVYSEEFGTNKEFTPEEKVAQDKINFTYLGSELDATSINHLNDLLTVLNEHKEFKIQVTGHCDIKEAAKFEVDDRVKGLTQRRVDAVIDFLVKGGIDKSRFKVVIKDAKEPLSAETDEVALAKNRRVEFKVVN